MSYNKEIMVVLLSYMIGCISTGYYLTRFFVGKDIRTYGSRSTGARNVGRVLGKSGFIITFLGDMAKGMVVICAASVLQIRPWAIMLSLLAVLIGHIWPIQLGFRGGKGIAVAFGALLILDCWIMMGAVAVFCLGILFLKKYEVSAFLAIAASPLIAVLARRPIMNICGIVVIAIIILFAHRRNICEFVHKVRLP